MQHQLLPVFHEAKRENVKGESSTLSDVTLGFYPTSFAEIFLTIVLKNSNYQEEVHIYIDSWTTHSQEFERH